MQQIFALSGLINAIAALAFGLLVITKTSRDRVGKLFFFLTLSVALWGFGYWLWLLSDEESTALFWVRILSIGSILIPVFYSHWTLSLLGIDQTRRNKFLIRSIYVAAVFFLSFSFSEIFIQGVRPKMIFSFWPVPGNLYTLFLLTLFAGSVSYSIWHLWRRYHQLAGERRIQIAYILIGSLFGFGGGATNFFLWYDIPILPYGTFLVALFPVFLGYAVLKHHLFNVKVLAAELLTFTIWLVIFVKMIMAETPRDRIQELALLALAIILGLILIKSVLRLDAANQRLKELDRQKSEFLSFASHQLKSPMTVIKGISSLIHEESYGPVPKKVKDAAIQIRIVTDRVIVLVEDFLDLGKIEEGKMEYQFAEINIATLTGSIVSELNLIAQQKKLDLSFDASTVSPAGLEINADESKLRQVIQNLIENSIKYTDHGYVKVKLEQQNDSIRLSVQDSGRGISEEHQSQLFQRFSRDKNIAKNIPGTGLGLFIAKEIISAHGGKIWAESKGEEKGATFFIELPEMHISKNRNVRSAA